MTASPDRSADIDRRVAEEVMGWKRDEEWPIWRDAEGWELCGVVDFRPSTDIASAWQVVDRLRACEPSIDWSDERHEWSVGFMKKPSDTWAGHQSIAMAICLAALRAAGRVG